MTGDFRADVLALVARIPEGKVASYGQLALLAGRPRSARIVGQIMGRYTEGLGLPCHRVIRSDGTLAEAAFVTCHMQREMLRSEGVPFTPEGRVDMRAARWEGPGEGWYNIPTEREKGRTR